MTTTKKDQPKKVVAKPAQPAGVAKDAVKSNPAAKTAAGIFAQIQAKTGLDDKKIDDWQKKWISLPEKRTKYEHLKDAPNVVGEEVYAIANDIIDFIQREEGGKSVIFKRIKENADSFIKNPGGYLKQRAEEGKKFAMDAKTYVEKKVAQVKEMSGKAKNKTNEVKKSVQAKEVPEKVAGTDTKPKSTLEKSKKTTKGKKSY